MGTIDEIRLLDNVEIPDGLTVEVVRDPVEFFARETTLNKWSIQWFGSAMRQGNRLQFLTTMSMQDYLNVVKVDQAPRHATVAELGQRSNRPKIVAQNKAIKGYLRDTACIGEKWIFPNFMLNYGVGWTEDMPKARLRLLVTDEETLSWAATFEPPANHKMPSTDGGHRTGSIKDLVEVPRERPVGLDAMLANGVGVTIVMDGDEEARRQDFADCGKSRGIADSIMAAWDLRNITARNATELVTGNTFLSRYVDATSPSVNLSTNSAQVWSMSAVRGSLSSAFWQKQDTFAKASAQEKEALLAGSPAKLGAFMDVLAARVPLLRQLVDDAAMVATSKVTGAPLPREAITPAKLRKERGGCVLMRGAGFGILMRAFRHMTVAKMTAAEMAAKLALVDWFMLTDNEPDGLAPQELYKYLTRNAHKAWFHLIAFNPGTGSWRMKGTNDNLDNAWEELIKLHNIPRVASKAEAAE